MALIASTGELRERVTLQAPQSGPVDARGQAPEGFVDMATVWANAEPLRGREFFAAAQQQVQTEVRFRIRYRTGILATWRVIWRGVPYQLVAEPIDTLGLRQQLELMTARIAGAGVAA